MVRCSWCMINDTMIEYHDKEWGVPLHDDHNKECDCYKKIVKNYPVVEKRRYKEG